MSFTQWILEPRIFERPKHAGGAAFHIRTQVKEASRGEEGEEEVGEGGEEEGAFLVGGFPPWVRKLQVDTGEAVGGKELRDIEACVELEDFEVKEFAFLSAEGGFACIFFTPFKSDISDMWVGFAVGESEAGQAAADFQFEGAFKAKEAGPVEGQWGIGQRKRCRLWTQRDT